MHGAGTSVFLIDLENFYLCREQRWREQNRELPFECELDLNALFGFAAQLAGNRRIVISRAYADFNGYRYDESAGRREYFLQPLARSLMEIGIEPVQVFRYPGGRNKNTVELRLAMDAVAMAASETADHFILVTGDTDVIPLILELKSRGAETAVIGVQGSTKTLLERYSDHFDYFENMITQRGAASSSNRPDLSIVRDALHALLHRQRPIKFAAVKPLLSQTMMQVFDPRMFDCETTGEFLREYKDELGIVIRRGLYDLEVDIHGSEPVYGQQLGGEINNQGGPIPGPAPGIAPLMAPGYGPGPPTSTGPPVPSPAEPLEHTARRYRALLQRGQIKIRPVDRDAWLTVTDMVFRQARDEQTGEVVEVYHEDIRTETLQMCNDEGMENAYYNVNAIIYLLFKSGCFVRSAAGRPTDQTNFHWSNPAVLQPDIEDAESMRRRALSFLARILAERIELAGMDPGVRAEPLAELLYGVDPLDEQIESTAKMLEEDELGPDNYSGSVAESSS